MKIFELKQLATEERKAMRSITTKAEGENRDLNEAEEKDFNTRSAKYDELMKRLDRLEKLEGKEKPNDDEDNAAEDEEKDDDELEDEDDDDQGRSKKRSSSVAVGRITRTSTPAEIVQIRSAAAVHTRKHEYSVLRAIRGLMNKNRPTLNGLEAEWSQEVARSSRRSPQGFYMPHHFGRPDLAEKRALSLTTGVGGIPTITEATLIEFLYNRSKVMQLGATVINDMVNKFSLPRMSATSTAYWVAEGGAPSTSNPTLDQVTFTPQTIADTVDLTRKFIMQNSTGAEMLVRKDITRVIGLGIDYAALNGTGTSNQPLGILQDPSTGSVSIGANSGAPTWTAVVDMETVVARANADVGKLAYLTSANGRGTLKTTIKNGSTGYPIYLCEDNEVNGYPLHVTNQIPTNFTQGTGTNLAAMTFGNWEEVCIALFGATDILVDPYSLGTSGGVRINIFQDADIHLRHEASFANLLFTNNQ